MGLATALDILGFAAMLALLGVCISAFWVLPPGSPPWVPIVLTALAALLVLSEACWLWLWMIRGRAPGHGAYYPPLASASTRGDGGNNGGSEPPYGYVGYGMTSGSNYYRSPVRGAPRRGRGEWWAHP